ELGSAGAAGCVERTHPGTARCTRHLVLLSTGRRDEAAHLLDGDPERKPFRTVTRDLRGRDRDALAIAFDDRSTATPRTDGGGELHVPAAQRRHDPRTRRAAVTERTPDRHDRLAAPRRAKGC